MPWQDIPHSHRHQEETGDLHANISLSVLLGLFFSSLISVMCPLCTDRFLREQQNRPSIRFFSHFYANERLFAPEKCYPGSYIYQFEMSMPNPPRMSYLSPDLFTYSYWRPENVCWLWRIVPWTISWSTWQKRSRFGLKRRVLFNRPRPKLFSMGTSTEMLLFDWGGSSQQLLRCIHSPFCEDFSVLNQLQKNSCENIQRKKFLPMHLIFVVKKSFWRFQPIKFTSVSIPWRKTLRSPKKKTPTSRKRESDYDFASPGKMESLSAHSKREMPDCSKSETKTKEHNCSFFHTDLISVGCAVCTQTVNKLMGTWGVCDPGIQTRSKQRVRTEYNTAASLTESNKQSC